MSRMRLVMIVVAVLVLAGCGGGEDGADVSTTDAVSSDEGAPSTTAPAAATTTAPGGDADIVISNFSFSGVDAVEVGSTVSVVNQDSIGHTWTVTDLFDSGTLSQGDTFEFTFDEAGEYEYYCVIHPTQMMGTLTVEG